VPTLVDGDNVLGWWRGRRRSDAERRALAFELDRLAARERRRILVVFDGTSPPGLDLGPDVRFAGAGCKADDLILALLRTEQDRAGWTVVTNDRSLGDQCRYLGARIERSDLLVRRLKSVRGGDKPEREEDVGYWLERFEGGAENGD
jgi:hypothetical protein